jgi:hypothetical protein
MCYKSVHRVTINAYFLMLCTIHAQLHYCHIRIAGDHDVVLEQQALAAAPMLPLYMAVVGRIAYRLCDDTSLCLSISNLNLRTPDGMALICNNLSFQLKCGDRLLLCGPRLVV